MFTTLFKITPRTSNRTIECNLLRITSSVRLSPNPLAILLFRVLIKEDVERKREKTEMLNKVIKQNIKILEKKFQENYEPGT